jgi:Glycosyltransferase like family
MLTVIYCTKETKPSHTEHIKKTSGLGKNIEVIEIINHGEGLTKPYNRGLKESSNDIVVFMHDDVEIETTNWGNKLLKHFDKTEYGIIGLAGTTDMPESGRWWEDRSKMLGIVNHKHEGKKWESKYSTSWGNEIKPVLIVDGLFFAVDKKRIKKNFNEDFTGFHFYEIDFVFSNYLAGVKVGVMFDIRVTHLSIGVTNEDWENSRIKFTELYKSNLPQKLVPEFPISEIESNDKCKVKLVVQSTGDLSNFNTLYSQINKYFDCISEIILVTRDSNYAEFKNLNLEKVRVLEGYFDTLPKNLSILKHDESFLKETDELIFFVNDCISILNNVFFKIWKIYNSNKRDFGGAFALTYNENKSIFCTRLELYQNKDGQVAINMKDSNSYYNYNYGIIDSPCGNLSDCFATTYNNLKRVDWFKAVYETPIYFNEFSLGLNLINKVVYTDTGSYVVQKSFHGKTNIQSDFQNLINFIGSNEKLKRVVKLLK